MLKSYGSPLHSLITGRAFYRLFQFEPRADEQEELSGSPTEYMDENVRAGEFEESSEEEDDDDEPLEMGSLLNS